MRTGYTLRTRRFCVVTRFTKALNGFFRTHTARRNDGGGFGWRGKIVCYPTCLRKGGVNGATCTYYIGSTVRTRAFKPSPKTCAERDSLTYGFTFAAPVFTNGYARRWFKGNGTRVAGGGF